MSAIYDITSSFARVADLEKDSETIINKLAALMAAGYNDNVVITNGNYVGKRNVVVSGHVRDVMRRLSNFPVLAAEHIDPNGMRCTMNNGFPVVELFATLYHGEK